MSHVRQQIRTAAALALAGLPTSGTRVFKSRLRPLQDAELPCLLVNTDNEQIDTQGVNNAPLQERTLSLRVRAVDKFSDGLDDALDAMLAEVEAALAGQTFGGLAKGLTLESIAIEMDDNLDKPVGIATATYAVTYYTAAGSPGTAL